MTRKLYGWEKDGKFYLSAFREARLHDGKRPAMEFETKDGLNAEVTTRQAELVWEEGDAR